MAYEFIRDIAAAARDGDLGRVSATLDMMMLAGSDAAAILAGRALADRRSGRLRPLPPVDSDPLIKIAVHNETQRAFESLTFSRRRRRK